MGTGSQLVIVQQGDILDAVNSNHPPKIVSFDIDTSVFGSDVGDLDRRGWRIDGAHHLPDEISWWRVQHTSVAALECDLVRSDAGNLALCVGGDQRVE